MSVQFSLVDAGVFRYACGGGCRISPDIKKPDSGLDDFIVTIFVFG